MQAMRRELEHMDNDHKEMIRAYRQRWEAVNEREQQERQHETLEQRWLRLNSLLGLAYALDLPLNQDGSEEVYRRWASLKKAT